ncbi:MAG: SAM-dependent methyltransferase [Nocardioidaceae bacterium]
MSDVRWRPWREAWEQALYGPSGFYRHAQPDQHFRTSVHASPMFARAIVMLVRGRGLDVVTDLGAGSGELVRQVHAIAADLKLMAIELRPRPDDLPTEIAWQSELPDAMTGLLLANEVLDNVACDVVQVDPAGVVRLVEADAATGEERLGQPVSAEISTWLEAWWPLRSPGDRAEVGLARDEFWRQACDHVRDGICLAIDYGHLRDYRPDVPTIRSYRAGRETALSLDGSHDVTAHVAIDSVAHAVGARVSRQRDMLRDLGLSGVRPDLSLSMTDAGAYVRALSNASEAAELMSSPGLGDFQWILSKR